MNRFGSAIFVASSVFWGATAVQGADFLSPANPQFSVQSDAVDWTGFYAGIYAGYGAGRASSTSVTGGAVTPVDVGGTLIGGAVGVNVQYGNLVLGAEGDVARSGVQGSAGCVGSPGYDCSGTLNWAGSGKLRAGYAFDHVLLFGTAGVAIGEITASTNPAAPGASGSFTSAVLGWTLGGGAELALSDAVSLRAEYAYYDFASVRAPINTVANLSATDIKSNAHLVKFGVNYRF